MFYANYLRGLAMNRTIFLCGNAIACFNYCLCLLVVNYSKLVMTTTPTLPMECSLHICVRSIRGQSSAGRLSCICGHRERIKWAEGTSTGLDKRNAFNLQSWLTVYNWRKLSWFRAISCLTLSWPITVPCVTCLRKSASSDVHWRWKATFVCVLLHNSARMWSIHVFLTWNISAILRVVSSFATKD